MAGLYDEKILGLRQQQEFARKIREQAAGGVEAGSMVGGHYVPNWGGMVANAMRQGMAGYEEGQAKGKEEDLTRQKLADSIKYMNQAGIEAPSGLLEQAGTKAVEPSLFSRAGAFLTGKEPPQAIPAQPYQQNVAQNVTPDQYEHAMAGIIGVNPEQAAPMVSMYQAKTNRALKESEDAQRKSHDEADLAWRKQNAQDALNERIAARNQADDTKRDMTALIHSGQNSGVNDQIITDSDGKMWAVNPRTHEKTDLGLSGKGSDTSQVKMNPTIEKAILENDSLLETNKSGIENLNSALNLNKNSYNGAYAYERAVAQSNNPFASDEDKKKADATIAFDNLIRNNAVSQLKATFGSNPTEGERKILLDLAASSNKTDTQREEIIQRGIQAAEKRHKVYTSKAEGLRTGNYWIPEEQAPVNPDNELEVLRAKHGG